MELSQILDSLSSPSASGNRGTEKTASYNNSSASSHNKLEQALNAALQTEKTASARQNTPGGDLVKIAQKLADAEQLALIKEAELYGAAVCDGFISRMNDHEMSGNVKTASFGGGGNVDEALVKQAMELGYRETTAELQKIAQQAFQQGYAEQAYNIGYNETVKTASLVANSQAHHVKTAAQRRVMIKTAAEQSAGRGYNHAMRILGNLA
jgi:hypothetical protein